MESPYIRRPPPARTAQECLQLDWSFGLHKDFKSVIHNLSHGSAHGSGASRSLETAAAGALSTSAVNSVTTQHTTNALATEQRTVFYPLAHIGILYDAVSNTQRHLLGHAFNIVASCCSHNRRFVVTCDEGDRALWGLRGTTNAARDTFLGQQEDFLATAAVQEEVMVRHPAEARLDAEDDGSLMIVWDTVTGLPVRTIPVGKYGGVVGCAMSPDGLYIATLNRRTPQEIMVWGWTALIGSEEENEEGSRGAEVVAEVAPEYVRRIPAQDEQTCVRFSPDDPRLLCTNGLRRVLFWSWQEGRLKYYSPPVIQGEWKVPIGNFTQSVFVPGTSMACSGTVDGDLVLWELRPTDRTMKEQDKTLLKMVRVHSGGGVTFLTSEGGYIVSGGMDGHVRFLDTKLRLVAWFEDINGGPIISVSFDKPLSSVDENIAEVKLSTQKHLQLESTTAAAEFTSPDFMVSTANAMIVDVPSRAFHTGDRALLRGKLLVQGQDQSVQSLAAHPTLSRVAIGGYSGSLHIWDYQQKRVVLLSLFRNLLIQSMAYDPTGTYLMVGFTNGTIKVLDAETLEDLQTFKPRKTDNILRMVFSQDGRMMATGTVSGCVGLYELIPNKNHDNQKGSTFGSPGHHDGRSFVWEFIGHHKTHKAPISGLQFQSNTSGEAIRLLSVGEDKRLIEYNLVESDVEAGLLLRTAHKITQGPLPTGFVWAKNVPILDDRSRPREAFGLMFLDDGDNVDYADDPADTSASPSQQRSSGSTAHGHRHTAEEDYLLIATNEYKISVYLSDWSRQCVKTVLAPTFGGPVVGMMIAPAVPAEELRARLEKRQQQHKQKDNHRAANTAGSAASGGGGGDGSGGCAHCPDCGGDLAEGDNENDEDAVAMAEAEKVLVYITREKVVGLMQLPLRGDPCASMGLLAHPGEITSATLSHDGRYLFTAGGDDQAMMQWRIDGTKILADDSMGLQATNAALSATERARDGESDIPLSHLVAAVEGGADGELMREVIDYFYYAQIRAQGEETTAKRELLGAIHFSQMPNLLRALGYYPTELDIGHLTFEVANAYGPRGEPLAEVDVDAILLDFAQFMRLYVNYRPVFGITRQAIEQAFATLGADAVTGNMARDTLFQLLSTKGEALHSAEITAALTSLLGDGVRLDMLEDQLSARAFAENLLGFEDYDADAKGVAGVFDGEGDEEGEDGSSFEGDGDEVHW